LDQVLKAGQKEKSLTQRLVSEYWACHPKRGARRKPDKKALRKEYCGDRERAVN
jgi:hypothetical protein